MYLMARVRLGVQLQPFYDKLNFVFYYGEGFLENVTMQQEMW
jgi:hypothetical protein